MSPSSGRGRSGGASSSSSSSGALERRHESAAGRQHAVSTSASDAVPAALVPFPSSEKPTIPASSFSAGSSCSSSGENAVPNQPSSSTASSSCSENVLSTSSTGVSGPRATVQVRFMEADGHRSVFKVTTKTRILKLLHVFCNNRKFNINSLRFFHDGERMNIDGKMADQTLETAGLENDDVIDVMQIQAGGRGRLEEQEGEAQTHKNHHPSSREAEGTNTKTNKKKLMTDKECVNVLWATTQRRLTGTPENNAEMTSDTFTSMGTKIISDKFRDNPELQKEVYLLPHVATGYPDREKVMNELLKQTTHRDTTHAIMEQLIMLLEKRDG